MKTMMIKDPNKTLVKRVKLCRNYHQTKTVMIKDL